MPHLDEGLIAELLDGETRPGGPTAREIEEHLEFCAACQHRLATARANRERARELLTRAAPAHTDVPSFAEVRARAAGVRRPGRRMPYRALGAAAVVAMAAGLGWYVRGTTMTPMPPAAPEPRTPAIVAAAPEEAAPVEPTVTGTTAAAEPPRAAVGERDEPVGRVGGAGTEAARNRQDDRALAAVKAAESLASAAPEREARRLVAQRAADPLGPVAVRAREEPASEPVRDAFAEDPWRSVPRAEAERLLGGRLALIEGLAVESHRVMTGGGEIQVRTTQMLPDGAEVELVQRRRPSLTDAAAPAPTVALRAERRDAVAEAAGATTVTVELDGFVVTGRARVPVDSLRLLLGRLRR